MIKKIIIFFVVVIFFFAVVLFTTPLWGKFAVTKILHAWGFPAAKIESLTPQQNGFHLTNITLNANQTSKINSAQLTIFPRPYILIKDAVISATLDKNFAVHITGWKPKSSLRYPFFEKIEVSNMTVNLLTALGSVELNASGTINKESDAARLQAKIVSKKEPVSFQAVLLGSLDSAKDNTWSYDVRADDIKINTPEIGVNRATLALKRNAQGVIEGQALIGLFEYRGKTIRQINLSVNSQQNPSFIVNAVGAEQQVIKGAVGKSIDIKSPPDFSFSHLNYYSFVITAPDITKLLSLISIHINDTENINGPVRLSVQTDIHSTNQLSWILTTEDSRIIQGYIGKNTVFD